MHIITDVMLRWVDYLFNDYNTHVTEHREKFSNAIKSHNSAVPCVIQTVTVFASKRTVRVLKQTKPNVTAAVTSLILHFY